MNNLYISNPTPLSQVDISTLLTFDKLPDILQALIEQINSQSKKCEILNVLSKKGAMKVAINERISRFRDREEDSIIDKDVKHLTHLLDKLQCYLDLSEEDFTTLLKTQIVEKLKGNYISDKQAYALIDALGKTLPTTVSYRRTPVESPTTATIQVKPSKFGNALCTVHANYSNYGFGFLTFTKDIIGWYEAFKQAEIDFASHTTIPKDETYSLFRDILLDVITADRLSNTNVYKFEFVKDAIMNDIKSYYNLNIF